MGRPTRNKNNIREGGAAPLRNEHEESRMYYIIESKYVGPNPEEMVDEDQIFITTAPALMNSNHEPCISGWCGTTNDKSITGHGEYRTWEEAEKAMSDIFGDVRQSDIDWGPRLSMNPAKEPAGLTVAVYRPGAYQPLSRSATEDWVSAALAPIQADTTDEQLDEIEEELEAEANEQGMTLYRESLGSLLERKRDELREELEETE